VIIGTAGHIDHGKTTLVRALTGIDTDRLPEEKARGISIELGYAYAPLANGDMLGFVDVPGHEKFVHTMLAGATGIDFALLVVAVDDGVMPQTREHLDIVTLLGVAEGAIALTKIDVVDAGRVDTVASEVRELAARTSLVGAPIFPVSSKSGTGLDALRAFLEARASAHYRRADNRHFRLAVDRSFTLPGIGTVVTGTVHSGEVRVGDKMIVAPSERETRVRGIHAQNRVSERGMAGERCALALAGVAREDVARGDWIVAPPIALSTTRLDVRITALADAPRRLHTGSTLHVHLGAAHAVARLVALDAPNATEATGDEIAPGTSRLAQLILQHAIAAWHGDRFIVRDASAMRTIGGGRVLDPLAPSRYRRSPERLAVLAALEDAAPEARLARLLEQGTCGVDLARFARADNVRDPDALARALPARRVASGTADFLIRERHWESLGRNALATLGAFHATHPDELGPDVGRLKRMAFPKLDATLYRALVSDLIAQGRIRQSGSWLHLPEHDNAPSAPERALIAKMLPRLLDSPFDPPWVRDLAKDVGQPESLIRTALIRASKRGEMFQVVRDLFYHPSAIRELATVASALQDDAGEIRAAAFRDSTSLGRKRAIQILEFFDRVGFTRRVRDRHFIRADNLLALDGGPTTGSGPPRQPAISEQRA
jgi:selenocysteine-specific elongation factor